MPALARGQTVTVEAKVKAPPSDGATSAPTAVLKWDLLRHHQQRVAVRRARDERRGALNQSLAVEDPTSDQLGLEKFYAYAGKNTGAGAHADEQPVRRQRGLVLRRVHQPVAGPATFVRLAYNSMDTSDTVAGYGWSLQATSVMRLGSPLDFHPNAERPTKVTADRR